MWEPAVNQVGTQQDPSGFPVTNDVALRCGFSVHIRR